MMARTTELSRRPAWLRASSRRSGDFGAQRNGAQSFAYVPGGASSNGMGMQLAASHPIDEPALAHWLKTAQPGDRLVYHIGHLGFDRNPVSALPRAQRETLARVASRTMAMAENGCLVLAQERLAEGNIAYLAIMPSCRRAECLSVTTP
jgi:hypothetical protein